MSLVDEERDAEERTSAVGLARYAFEYIKAAALVDEDAAKKSQRYMVSPIPAYFLAVHGIELTLKAYLRYSEVSVRDLSKKYGHDLHKCYRKAKELGLLNRFKEHANDRAALELLADLNQGHGLRYIKTGPKQFPHWSIVYPLAVRLHQAVAPVVGYRSFQITFGEYSSA